MLLAVAGLIALVLLLPVGLHVSFAGEFRARLYVLGLPFTLYPKKEKKARTRKTRPAKAAKKKKKAPGEASTPGIGAMLKEDGVGAVLSYLQKMASLIGTAVQRLLAAIVVDRLQLCMVLAGEDAAQTAVLHGAACGVVFPALALLQTHTRVRSREVQVVPDFVQGEQKVTFDVRLHACPLRLLWAGLRLLMGFVGNTLKDDTQTAVREKPAAAK